MRHTAHGATCFMDHLCDAIKLLTWRSLCKTELDQIAAQYGDEQKTIVEMSAKVIIHEKQNRTSDDLGTLGPFLDEYREMIRTRRFRQDALHRREIDLGRKDERIKALLNTTMTGIYDTAPKYYLDTSRSSAGAPDFLDHKFIDEIGLAKSCAAQVRAAQDLFEKSRQNELSLDARGLLLRNLQGLRTDMTLRESRLLRLANEPELFGRADLRHFLTAANLQQFQDQILPLSVEEDQASDLTRQAGRLFDGRPTRPEDRETAGWSDIVNGIEAPLGKLEDEVRISQLAENVYTCTQAHKNREDDLHSFREEYFFSLSSNFFAFDTMTREWFEGARVYQGLPPFATEEDRLSRAVETSRQDLAEARQAMRSYIDSKRVPTEDTFREQTNDRNSGNDAAGLRMGDARAAKPPPIRRWQASIARDAVPSGMGTSLSPSSRNSSIDVSSIGFSERLLLGSVSDHSVAAVSRREKWLQRNQAIVQQRRQHLESQGIVFQKDDIAQN